MPIRFGSDAVEASLPPRLHFPLPSCSDTERMTFHVPIQPPVSIHSLNSIVHLCKVSFRTSAFTLVSLFTPLSYSLWLAQYNEFSNIYQNGYISSETRRELRGRHFRINIRRANSHLFSARVPTRSVASPEAERLNGELTAERIKLDNITRRIYTQRVYGSSEISGR